MCVLARSGETLHPSDEPHLTGLTAGTVTRSADADHDAQILCRSKMRSSYSSKVESSCSEPAKCRDERTGDAGVEHEGSGSIEGVARGEAGTFNAARGGRATRVH